MPGASPLVDPFPPFVGPPPRSGYVEAPDGRKTWKVETCGNRATTHTIESDVVSYGAGVIEFYVNGELVALYNLDSVVSVRTAS